MTSAGEIRVSIHVTQGDRMEAKIREFVLPVGFRPTDGSPPDPLELMLTSVASCFLASAAYAGAVARLGTGKWEAEIRAEAGTAGPQGVGMAITAEGPPSEEGRARTCFRIARQACTLTNALVTAPDTGMSYGSAASSGPEAR